MQDGRSNNQHHPGAVTNIITHDSGKSLNYRQLNGQHTCASSTSSKRIECNTTDKENIVAGQALVLSPKGTNIPQSIGEPSPESPIKPHLNAKQLKSIKKKRKYKQNMMKRNDVHLEFAEYMKYLSVNQPLPPRV